MRLLALLFFATSARAAVLTGVVLDFDSARPLARSVVTLTPALGGAGATPQTTRTESNGSFFLAAAPGVYILTLTRPGFATYNFGAKCWNCPGAPVFLNGNDRTAVDVRMHRLGAITGTVFDENQIGIPEIPVIVYTATRPLKPAGKGITDDRGFFRVGGLDPGPYVVRTQAIQTRDGMTYLAGFYPEGTEMRLARSVVVELERTWANVDFPAIPGRLYRVQGRLGMPSPGVASSIELIADFGRLKVPVDGQGNFFFDRVPPGNYELYAEGRDRSAFYAAWQPLNVDKDMDVGAQLAFCGGVNLSVFDSQHRPLQNRENRIKVKLRRKDLDQEGPEIPLRQYGRNEIGPGNWEIAVDAGPDGYTAEITVQGRPAETRVKASVEGWSLVRIGPAYNNLQVTVSNRPATITGRVTDRPNDVVPYAPVFLETVGLDPPDPPLIRETRTAADGTFQFTGLSPAKYRLLASFDLDLADHAAAELAHPSEFTLAEGGSAVQDLALFHRP